MAYNNSELKAFLNLAVPLATAQLAQALVGLVDTLMMGHLGIQSLAAGALASSAFHLCLYTTGGVLMSVSPLVAQAYGGGHKTRVEDIARQGLWLSLMLAIPLMLVLSNFKSLIILGGQSPDIAILADGFLRYLLWGAFPALGFIMLRSHISAFSLARPVMVIVAIGTVVNIIGNYALGYGKLGFSNLGLPGLGLSSGISFWVMFLLLLSYHLYHPLLKQYPFWSRLHQLKPKIMRQLLYLGLPMAGTIAVEAGLFALVTFLMGRLGPQMLAAHQIVSQTIILIFMIPMGMSNAVTIRVSQWLGKLDYPRTRQAGYTAVAAVAGFMTLMGVILLLFPQQIMGIYLPMDNPESLDILRLAMPILTIAAVSQLLDGVQRVAMGALHGLQDTHIPMVLSILSFWGVGLTTGYLLGFPGGLGGVGLWIGQSLGVAVAGVIFLMRFHWLTTSLKRQ